jgi:FMN-dependent NADH-azoreductase
MNVLLLNASPHGETSHGYRLAKEIVASLSAPASEATAGVHIIERDLNRSPLPPISRDYARAITSSDPDAALFDQSERLIGELEATDMLLINTPMHNFTVPAALKLWIDYVLRIHRTFRSTPEGKIGLMRDRPTFVIVGSGGFHSGERARQHDFLTPYLRYALEAVGIRSVRFLLMEGLVMGEDAVSRAFELAKEAYAMSARHPNKLKA